MTDHWEDYWIARLTKSKEAYEQLGVSHQELVSGPDLVQLREMLLDRQRLRKEVERLQGVASDAGWRINADRQGGA